MEFYLKDGDQCSGIPLQNFDLKVALFSEWCAQTEVSEDEKPGTLFTMLRDLYLQHYFDEIQGRSHVWPEPVRVSNLQVFHHNKAHKKSSLQMGQCDVGKSYEFKIRQIFD